MPYMIPQATHSDYLPDQNTHQSFLSNTLPLFSGLVVTRAISSILINLDSLLDKVTAWFPDVIYTWLFKLQEDTNKP